MKGARKVGGTGKRKKEKGSSRFSSCSRTRLSRTLKQANWCTAQGSLAVLGQFLLYVPSTFQCPYPIIVYSSVNYGPHLGHFWTNVILRSQLTVSHFLFMHLPYTAF